MEDPLLKFRKKIAQFTLAKSFYRLQNQRNMADNYDQGQLDSIFDRGVASQCMYQSVATEYGDASSVTKGTFDLSGQLYACVGTSGQGKIFNFRGGDDFGEPITTLKSQNKLFSVALHPRLGSIPKFAPNIVTGSGTGEVLVWTFDQQLNSQKSIKIQGHSDRINNIEFYPNGDAFITSSYDKSWSLWDAKTLKLLCNQKGHAKQIHALSLHPDGSLLLTGDLGGEGMLWDLRTGKGVYNFTAKNSVVCSAFHPNGSQFAISGKSNLIQIFDLRRKKTLQEIPAHIKLVSDLKYSVSGYILFSGSHDMSVKMWHGRNYTNVGETMPHSAKITTIDSAGEKLVVGMLDRKITLCKRKKVNLFQNGQMEEERGVKIEENGTNNLFQ